MNDDWRDKLAKKYPSLYRGYKGDPTKTIMAWGFAVGDGWRGILEELSAKINALDPKDFVIADQVKEKFGGLRFYYHIEADDAYQAKTLFKKVERLVRKASDKSYETCEKCGRPGSTDHPEKKPSSWICVLCDDCAKKEMEK